jgi:thiosulfate dehydrogenase
MSKKILILSTVILFGILFVAACAGGAGPQGPEGAQGLAGPPGPAGPPGTGLTVTQTLTLDSVANLTAIQFPVLDEVRRGCPACHVLVDKEKGNYTLAFEAHERAEARGEEHPDVAPDGTSILPTDDVSIKVCLQCHAPGTGDRAGKGVVAPLSLRDIVHPAHMNSQYFKLHYGGNCFTCHNVNGEGGWDLLSEKVDVNEKGVPNDELLPIPGAIPIGEGPAVSSSVSRGGRLYDNWWVEAGVDEPTSDQPLWASQTTNTRSGSDTWRCKECHGWDYKGADGAYGSGSHMTGFPGVFGAQTKTTDEIVARLSGSVNPDHDFSAMGDEAVNDLAAFLQSGLVDVTPLIDAETKSAVNGDSTHGKDLYAVCAACHGEDGLLLNFGSAEEPEFVGTIALDNPWEFLHKVRVGQPGSIMPAAMDGNWSFEDLLDLLSFAQTLPVVAP